MKLVQKFKTILVLISLTVLGPLLHSHTIYLGMGAKAGEITDKEAIIHVRLTKTAGQDEHGLVPGMEGQARVHYGSDTDMHMPKSTAWMEAKAVNDYSVQFYIADLDPATRYYYKVEMRAFSGAEGRMSKKHSFKTAPQRSSRLPVKFQVTTGQDILGIGTYYKMAAQKPDFLVSTGDNVYYDEQCDARTVEQAYQCYQLTYGSNPVVDYFQSIGGYFEKDDHDYRFNDADPFMKGRWIFRENIRPGLSKITDEKGDRVYDETWLTHEEGVMVFKNVFPMSEKTYRTFRWGKGVQIWLLEGRDFRSPNTMPDGPEKTIWGAEQKSWLKSTLHQSDADYKIIISPTPIIGPDRQSKKDNHANKRGFWTEGRDFLTWIKENEMDNVILACGDRHWQYHSVYAAYTHEFSCGPTCDEHSVKDKPAQHPPDASEFEAVAQPYVNYCGGFLTVEYQPETGLVFEFYDENGKNLYAYNFTRDLSPNLCDVSN